MRKNAVRAVIGFVGLVCWGLGAEALAATRPTYNHGVGFFVLNGKLYDANGNEFRIRGVNKVHWDSESIGLPNSHANTVRWDVDFSRPASDNVAMLQGGPNEAAHGTIYDNMVVIPGNWDGTCDEDPATLSSIVDTWVAQASAWRQIERYSIINIANEWGPDDSTVWRDSYIAAVARLRAAGYHATISITAGGCGQDNADIVNYAQAIFDSDPEKNVIFDQHIYGMYSDIEGGVPPQWDGQQDLSPSIAALQATGLVVIVGEFGPGRNIGLSPTMITPTRVMQKAEGAGLGWMAWAWDDNDQPDGKASDDFFAMSFDGSYNTSSDLTTYGRQVVEGSPGLIALATRASIFP